MRRSNYRFFVDYVQLPSLGAGSISPLSLSLSSSRPHRFMTAATRRDSVAGGVIWECTGCWAASGRFTQ